MRIRLRSEATIRKVVSLQGIGVHSGKSASIRIMPAPASLGVIFKRTDVTDKNPFISLSPDSVVDPIYCTRVTNKDGVTVSVIEHLLAAFRLTGITNALVEINSDEVPIMDGSASVFMNEINVAGVVTQNCLVPTIIIKKIVIAESQNGKITLSPSKRSRIKVKLDYDRINPVIGANNSYEIDMDTISKNPESSDIRHLAASRTFGWAEDLERIQGQGIGLGASEENTIGILVDNSIMNDGGLRYTNELVMHKCLDVLGDMFILGCDVMGDIECTNPSHSLNNQLLRKLLQNISEQEVFVEQQFSTIPDTKIYKFA
jgi:UDP-3-O-[3-hydroxymyristoyl] N-acetylglucosamine deacetylase